MQKLVQVSYKQLPRQNNLVYLRIITIYCTVSLMNFISTLHSANVLALQQEVEISFLAVFYFRVFSISDTNYSSINITINFKTYLYLSCKKKTYIHQK